MIPLTNHHSSDVAWGDFNSSFSSKRGGPAANYESEPKAFGQVPGGSTWGIIFHGTLSYLSPPKRVVMMVCNFHPGKGEKASAKLT